MEKHRRDRLSSHPGKIRMRPLASSIIDVRLHSQFQWTTSLRCRLLKDIHIPCIIRTSIQRSRHTPRPCQLLFGRYRHNRILPLRFSKAEPRLRDLLSRLNGLRLLKLNRAVPLSLINASETTDCARESSSRSWIKFRTLHQHDKHSYCQHPILAHRLPTQGLLTEAQVTIPDPAIGGERTNMGARTTGEKQGLLEKRKRAIKRMDEQGTPKQQKPALMILFIVGSTEHAFLTGLPGRPIHGQVNGTRKQAFTHPRTTRTMEQVSDCLSEFILVSRWSRTPLNKSSGHVPDKLRPHRSPNTPEHSRNTEKTSIAVGYLRLTVVGRGQQVNDSAREKMRAETNNAMPGGTSGQQRRLTPLRMPERRKIGFGAQGHPNNPAWEACQY
ncbi:hypothetical protein CRG98_010001 [Punica granatum]|uniref:Uncharacterized protein n=1 Tax=Punica granatum TaxID=22663 RepID=A0A2I0KMD5_PUNGR|nr:hypothetical protein CRG98_010001 [Punica granatum]